MNYFPLHIGDFNNATRHLSRIERSIYFDLLMIYYETEMPLQCDRIALARRALVKGMDEVEAMGAVLDEFFTLEGDLYHHERCDEELEIYKKRKGNHWAKSLTRDQKNEIEAARRARKVNATPPWLNSEHRTQMVCVYQLARRLSKETGEAHEVDHIIPISGIGVCGLHVPWNLQAIPAYKNRLKSNR